MKAERKKRISTAAKTSKAKEISETRTRGHPRSFPTEQYFLEALERYLEACRRLDNRMPTVYGFATFVGCTSETVRASEEYYPQAYMRMKDAFQDALVNCKATKNLMGIFTLKDQFGWQDNQQSAITVNYNQIPEGQLQAWLTQAGLEEKKED